MKITELRAQRRISDRVNVYVDGAYSFSLADSQIIDLGVKIGRDYSEAELDELKRSSQLGKLYYRSLNYCLSRPHSQRELRDYLSRPGRQGTKNNPIDKVLADEVIDMLTAKGYLDDHKFAKWWAENRRLRKGISRRLLQLELRQKGISDEIIAQVLEVDGRQDSEELPKVIARVSGRYADKNKLISYLQRQGFSYDDIVSGLKETD